MAKPQNWVIYKEIKGKVSMEMVLERYGLLGQLKKSGKNLVGCCPIHQGSNGQSILLHIGRWTLQERSS